MAHGHCNKVANVGLRDGRHACTLNDRLAHFNEVSTELQSVLYKFTHMVITPRNAFISITFLLFILLKNPLKPIYM